MKKIILLILLVGSVYGQNEGFTTIDTLVRTVSTTTYDTLDLSTGYKSIEIWNQTGGVLNVAFKNTNRDTVNIIQIQNNAMRILNYNKNRYIYLKSSVSGTAKIIAHYGYGEIDYPVSYSSTGEILVTLPQATIDSLQTIAPSIDTIIYIDSVGAGDSVKLFDTRGYDMALLYITANADTTLDTMILYTVTASGGTYPIGVKLLYGNSDETFIASNATSNAAGLSYFVFSPYPETLMIRLINTYYLDVRKVYFELHLIRKR